MIDPFERGFDLRHRHGLAGIMLAFIMSQTLYRQNKIYMVIYITLTLLNKGLTQVISMVWLNFCRVLVGTKLCTYTLKVVW